MQDHSVAVARGRTPADISFAPIFNVAVPFIDRHIAEGRAAKTAIRTAAGDLTYGALASAVNRAGNAFLGHGITRGERMLMAVKDCPEFVFAFWGAIKAGVVPVPLNTLLKPDDYRFMIEDSGAAALLYSPEFAAQVEPALAAARPRPRLALKIGGDGPNFLSTMESASDRLGPAAARPEDDCFWLYSSGSTGRPKGAVHLQRDMAITSQLYGADTLGVRESDVCYSAAKLFFAYGLGNAMTFPLWAGATAVLDAQRPTPQVTFDVIARFKPTLYFGVPTLYAAQLQAIDQAKPDLSSIRLCVSAGEALPPDILRRWREKTGLAILDGIGSTEALHIFISNRADDVKPGSSGRVVPGYEARIVKDDGGEAAIEEPGRLMIKGRSSAKYYWNNPERTRTTMNGEWLDTGDTYYRDNDGYYFYCGRSDDMLKVGGIWCSPFEIEARLIEHPQVLEAAIVGRADDDGLIKPEAHIVLKRADDAGPGLEDALRRHCKEGLAPYKFPRWFNFVAELPKTATGKIQRFKLRASA